MRTLGHSVSVLGLALLAGACGGRVNLGERADPGAQAPDESTNDLPDDPYYVPSQRLTSLEPGKVLDELAVFGDYLYLTVLSSGHEGLYRCRKDNCQASLARPPGNPGFLQAFGVQEQRLVVAGGSGGSWVGSYALPDVTDEQVVIDQLPSSGASPPLFHRGYAYWSIPLDQSIFRCSLPACAHGPSKVGVTINGRAPYADGELLFFLNFGRIYRAAGLGDGPMERLLPDASLSPAPLEVDASDPQASFTGAIQTSAGMLYATVTDGPAGCVSDGAPTPPLGCQTTFARWPVTGGPREDLFVTPDNVGAFFVFGSELAWVTRPSDSLAADGTLATCRLEDCSATLRHLGQAVASLQGIAADTERLYWLQSARFDGNPREVAIRSVALLPAP